MTIKPFKLTILFLFSFCVYAKGTDSCGTLLTKARILMDRRDYAGAIIMLDGCLENDPDNAAANNMKGCAFITLSTINDLKNVRKAIACFNKAIKAEPANYTFYNNRGWAYSNLDSNMKATADYATALQLDSNSLALQMNVLRMLFVRNRNKEAYAYCDKLIRMFPDDGYAYYVRGNLKRDYLHKYPEGNIDIKMGEQLGWQQGMYLMY